MVLEGRFLCIVNNIFLKSLFLCILTVSFPVLVTVTYRGNQGRIHPMNVTEVPRMQPCSKEASTSVLVYVILSI